MDNKELVAYVKSRFRAYTYHEYNLKSVINEKDFKHCREEFLSDYFDDIEKRFEIDRGGRNLPEPIVKQFSALQVYADKVMQTYVNFKLLMGF